jgi:flagellar L-ring protein FlgH
VTRSFLIVLACLSGTLLMACASRPPEPTDDTFVWPQEPPPVVTGAIYQPGRDVALFENATARHVGDVILVRLVESTSAQKSSSTSTTKDTKAALPGPTIAGRTITSNGNDALGFGLDHSASFDGKGDSAQSNSLNGDITVTVVKRLPNGNLLIRGEKWIGINQGSEYVRVEGVIRPIDIAADNSILSSMVGNAKISYRGRGALADSNKQGWLARFFNSPLMPF